MAKVIFKFSGGPLDGKTVVGGAGTGRRSPALLCLDLPRSGRAAVPHRVRLCGRHLDQRGPQGRALAPLSTAHLPGHRPHPERRHCAGSRRIPAKRGAAGHWATAAASFIIGGVKHLLLTCCLLLLAAGCDLDRSDLGRLQAVWGRQGLSDGQLQKPRAMAIDRDDHLYIVDMTARIQVFTTRRRVPPQVADARPRQRQADRPVDRPRRQRPGGRHALLPRAGLFARGQAAGDAGGQAGAEAGGVRLVSPARSRIARATTTSPNTAITTAFRNSRPKGDSFANGAATAPSPVSSSGPSNWSSTRTRTSG